MSNTCFAGIRKVTSHSERNSMILVSSLGRMFWTAWSAGSISGTCAVVGTPTVRLAYSSAKKSRHILETHWLGFSISIVIFARGHGSGSVDRQCKLGCQLWRYHWELTFLWAILRGCCCVAFAALRMDLGGFMC